MFISNVRRIDKKIKREETDVDQVVSSRAKNPIIGIRGYLKAAKVLKEVKKHRAIQ